MSIEGVAAQLEAVVTSLPIEQTQQVVAGLGRDRQSIAEISAATTSASLQAIGESLAEAEANLTEAAELLGNSRDGIGRYLAGLGFGPYFASLGLCVGPNTTPAAAVAEAPLNTTDYQPLTELVDDLLSVINDSVPLGKHTLVQTMLVELADHLPLIHSSLQDPEGRRIVLEQMRRIFTFGPGVDVVLQRLVRQSVTAAIASDIYPLAVQTEDEETAQLATDLLFATYADPFERMSSRPEITALLAQEFGSVVKRNEQRFERGIGDTEPQGFNGQTISDTALELVLQTSPPQYSAFVRSFEALRSDTDPRIANLPEQVWRQLCAHIDSRFTGNFNRVFKKFGLDPGELDQSWLNASSALPESPQLSDPYSKSGYRLTGIRRILELEAKHSGSAVLLRQTLGIRNFGCHAPKTLQLAYEAVNAAKANPPKSPPKSFVVYVKGEPDPKAAFYRKAHVIEHLAEELAALGSILLPVEIINEAEILATQKGLDQDGWGQAEHIVGTAHGQTDGAWVGINERITSSSLPRLAGALRRMVKKDGSFILISCSTGKTGPQSFAANFANHAGRRVVAPDDDTAIEFITARRDPNTGGIELGVGFDAARAVEFLPVT